MSETMWTEKNYKVVNEQRTTKDLVRCANRKFVNVFIEITTTVLIINHTNFNRNCW